jgi:hypothetical protein
MSINEEWIETGGDFFRIDSLPTFSRKTHETSSSRRCRRSMRTSHRLGSNLLAAVFRHDREPLSTLAPFPEITDTITTVYSLNQAYTVVRLLK